MIFLIVVFIYVYRKKLLICNNLQYFLLILSKSGLKENHFFSSLILKALEKHFVRKLYQYVITFYFVNWYSEQINFSTVCYMYSYYDVNCKKI